MAVPNPPEVAFADAELMATTFLREQLTEFSGLVVAVISPTTLAAPTVRVRRIGGAWARRKVLDNPRLDIDCWGSSPANVNTLIEAVRAALASAGGYHGVGGYITYSRELSGPTWRPETNPALYRKGLSHELMIRPT